MEDILNFKELIESTLEGLDDHRRSSDFLVCPRAEQVLLNRQSVVMHGLLEVLNERIALTNKPRS